MRRALPRFIIALAAFGVALQACDKVEVVTPDPPRVSIAPAAITIDVGERTRLAASVVGGGGTAGTVSWSSSAPAVVSVDGSGEIVGLAVGNATVSARSGGGVGTATVTVRPPSSVLLDRPSVNFTAAPGGVAAPETVAITAPGSDGMTGLAASALYTPGQPAGWLRTALSSTSTPASLLISADARNLTVGTYTATIEITADGSTATSISVTLQVVGAPPTIALNADSVGFAANEAGTDPQPQQIAITNSGTGSLGQLSVSAITYASGQPNGWLNASVSAVAAPSTLVLDAAVTSLVQGVYTATLEVISPDAANSPRPLQVTFNVTAPLPIIALNPTTLAFDAVQGGSSPIPQTVSVTNGGIGTLSGLIAAPVYTSSPIGWIVTSLSNATAPATVTVSIDPSGLAPGDHAGFLRVESLSAANSPVLVPVDLTVTAPPVIALSQATATFSATAGQADPPTESVVITNIGGSVLDGLAVDSIVYALGQRAGWLSTSLSFPLAPSTLALDATLNPPGGPLAPGTYDATAYVGSTADGVTNSPQVLAVAFFVVNTDPVATITAPPSGRTYTASAPVTFTGSGADAEDGTLTGPSLVWSSDLDGPLGTSSSVTTTALTLGSHTVTLTVTDSQGATGSASTTVTIDSAPTAAITSPSDSSVFNQATTITFTGTGTDPEDGALGGTSLIWMSSQNGAMGTGASLPYGTLTAGFHTISLIAVDAQGAADTASIVVRINALPKAAAGPDLTVADGDGSGDEVVALDGSGSVDAEGALVSYDWSEGGANVGTGATPTVTLAVGTHTIVLTVTDSDGAQDADTVSVTVGANQPPTASIVLPLNGAVIDEGTAIVFDGSATDPEDGSLTGGSLTWSSDVDGFLSSGTAFSISGLSPGSHLITLTALDSGGAGGVATANIRVNALPTADAGPDQTAIADADNSGDEVVNLDGSASFDPEGVLSAYQWSEAGTVLSTVAAPALTLAVGQHTLTLAVTDSDGAQDTDDVVVSIGANSGPSATITSPPAGSVFAQGTSITFAGSGTDPEDGALLGPALSWSSDISGSLGTGSSVSTSGLPPGTHSITLTATDSGGFTGTDAIVIRINAPPTADAGLDQVLSDADNSGAEVVTLDGSASSDPEGPVASFTWSTPLATIPSGVSPTVTLPVGVHTVTLTVTDQDGSSASDAVVVTVGANTAPTAAISSPPGGTVFALGAPVPLVGTGSDSEDGSLSGGSLVWSSTLNGPIGSGGSIAPTSLVAGTHTVVLTATDAGGLTGTAAVSLRVNAPPTAAAGADQIVVDADNSGAEQVTLNGSASSDPEGPVAGYLWTEGGATIGTGVSPTVNLALGSHAVTLTVTDADGSTATDDVVITVGANTAPSATIQSPGSGAVFTLGTSITFDGAGTDPEDGMLSGGSLSWNSSLNGALGTGTSLPTSALAAGTHTISLTATDAGGLTGTDAITVRVNTTPTADAGPDQSLTDADGDGDEAVTLDGSGSSDPEGALISYVWTEASNTVAIGVSPTTNLSVGVHNITLTVTDSDGAQSTDAVTVTVAGNSPPVAVVSAPANGSVFTRGTPVGLIGTGSDAEDGPLTGASLTWTSSLNGLLGTGGSLSTSALTAGIHTITLTATDAGGLTGIDAITVRINALPVANAGPDQTLADADNTGNEPVTLDGSGSSDAEGPLTNYVWTEGGSQIATGPVPTIALLVGVHTITLTVTDSDGVTATDDVVVAVGANNAPTATISAPSDGATFAPGAVITFTGSGDDVEDGALAGGSLSWTSNLDGSLGTGGSVSTGALSSGTHVVTLTATDSGGVTGTDAITVRINAPPVADAGPDQMVTDADNSGTESVMLDGSGSTDAEGALASYAWAEGATPIGTGVSPSVVLSVGVHNITLTVTDSDGATATDDLVVTVGANTAPTAAISSPPDGSVFDLGVSVAFTGSGSDAEDGPLTLGSLVWSSDIAGVLGTGTSVSTSALVVGTHTITLTATDSGLLTGTDVITVRINAPPTANAGPDQNLTDTDGGGDEQVTLDGSGSADTDGTIVSWDWSGAVTTTGVSSTVTLAVGVHNITLTVTDSDGATATDDVVITIGANTAPTATITSPPDGSVFQPGASVTLIGNGSDLEDGTLPGTALAWSSDLNGALGTGTSLATSALIVGTHTITLTATDSGLLTGTDVITVRINAPPTANAGPDQNVTDTDGGGDEQVTLDGSGSTDTDGTIVSWDWSGAVTTTGVSSTVTLAVGVHNITLTVTDSDGATATDDVVITIGANTAPTATITSPPDGSVFQPGASVTLIGNGSDLEDGTLPGTALAWSSDLNGALGTGTSLATSALIVGTHTITLTATDSGLLTGTDVITVRINAPPTANAGPDQNVTDTDGSGDEQVTLDGSSSTDTDGTIVSWDWSGAVTTTGVSPTVTLAVGVHNITLTVTDNDGATATDDVVITIGANTAPTATITSPPDGSVFQPGASVTLIGNGSDLEDGTLPGTALAWSSDLNGALGTGTSLATSALVVGTHTITLTATDSGLLTGTDVITIRINAPPTANAGADQSLTDTDGGGDEQVTLDGSGSTDTDGTIVSWDWSGAVTTTGVSPTVTLAVGVHNITLTVTDSDGATGTDDVVITIGANTAPTATITSPPDGSVFQPGASVTLIGNGSDLEDGTLPGTALAWSSDLNGALGTGTSLATSALVVGTHTITLTATDSGLLTGTDVITIRINAPPTANAGADQSLTDTDGGGDEQVTLDGSGSTDTDGTIVSWDWSGAVTTTGVSPTVTLAVGVHNITLTVTDSDGATGTDDVVITIGANTAPTATITSPPDGSVYQPGASVTLIGNGSDLEDGTLPGTALAWSSDLNGALGTGTSLATSALIVGTHTITLTATDSGLLTGTDVITVRINAPPTANAGPDQNVTDTDGGGDEQVTLDGSGSTDTDGTIVSWDWSGAVTTTGVNPTVTLAVGVHNITLTITDSDGATATDDVVITVVAGNTAPIATITSPADGSVFQAGASVTLIGNGSDTEDGTLPGTALAWTSDLNGALGTGTSLATSALVVGTHTITLTATDSGLLTGTDVITVRINAPPTANAGADQNVTDTDGGGDEQVTLDGSGSTDTDGTIVSWDWSGAVTTTGVNPTVTLAVGVHNITLTVTDSDGATATDDVVITVLAGNTAPTATITSPADGSVFQPGASVTLIGNGSDTEDGTLPGTALAWSSDLNGALGTGTSLATSALVVGTHTITLTATDSGLLTGTDVITVRINAPPTANAGADQNVTDTDGGGDEQVTLDGSGSTDTDGTIVSWDWSGAVTTTGVNPTVTLAVGVHNITLTVTDSDGATATDDVVITVLAGNTAPTATITSPADGSVFQPGASVTLIGNGSDTEDGTLPGTALAWSSDLNGALGTGTSLATSALVVGTHTITLTATDSGLLTGTDVITVRINAPPTANAGADQNVTDTDGGGDEQVTLDGSGSTDTDGTIVSWDWSGAVTTTGVNPTVTLAVGVHNITLTVTDSDGATATDDVVITVLAGNTAPTATITSPADGSVFQPGASVTLIGNGSDTEDGTLPGTALAWSSDLNGALGTGTSLATSALVVGTHTITLTATDSGLLTGTDVITVRINAPPTANAGADQNVTDTDGGGDEQVTLDGSGSTDTDGTIVSWDWSGAVTTTGVSPTVTLAVGVHNITLTVTDSDGATATDDVVITVLAGNTAPTATITSPADGSVFQPGASVTLIGNGSDLEDGTLPGTSLAWSSDLNGALGTGTSLATSALVVGTHTITLTATDSGLLTGTDVITVRINALPTANAGADQNVTDTDGGGDEQVTLDGSGSTDTDGTIVSWDWSGAVTTTGVNPTVTLAVGVHNITLTVTDSDGATATDDVVITVLAGNTAPTATITSPADGSVFQPGASVTLIGNGSDTEDGTLPGTALAWSSDLNGALGTGTSLATSALVVGTHTITLTATDSGLLTGTDVITVRINAPPTANAGADQNVTDTDGGGDEQVTLDGSGSTDTDGTIVSWDWSGAVTTTGVSPTVTLAVGVHNITLTVTDSDGATATDDVMITIAANQSPTANAGPDQPSVPDPDGSGDQAVTLDGSLSTDDGSIVTYDWTAPGVTIPSGVTPTATFPVGPHTITLTVTDDGGATDADDVIITVLANAAPAAAISAPATGMSFPQGTQITFTGSGTDPEEGALTGGSLVWTSDIDGQIGTGVSFQNTTLTVSSPGAHTITLTVTDAGGLVGTAVITVTIT